MLVQGRAKLIEEDHAKRYKLLTRDDNEVDSIFVDNRGANVNGKTLVICSEGKRKYAGTFSRKIVLKNRLIAGNAGFYEIGIMVTPMALKYSVLGWNHPGFGGSTVNITKSKHKFMVSPYVRLFVSQGQPFPNQDQNAMDAVVQFAINKLGFAPENIVLFGWSIGGYSSLWASTQYPDIKGVVSLKTIDSRLVF